MSEELMELSRRLVACKNWRWMPGMKVGNDRIMDESETREVRSDELPDLTDPATLGCLLALVREAWGDPGFYTAQSSTKIKGTDIFGWDTFGYLHGKSCKGMLYRSEAEALVSALESAS